MEKNNLKTKSDGKEANLNENLRQKDTIPGNQTERPTAENPDETNKPKGGRTFKETTDPDKLSDL